jgi:hypothetical protein
MGSKLRNLDYLLLKGYRRLVALVCSKLYRDTGKDIHNSIMIAGTARSGTTWLANIIASQRHGRIMFEPFNPRKVEAFRQFHYFQYMRPAEEDNELWSYCQKVFTGDIRHSWIDREVDTIFPKYRVIKEIRANLFLKWIHNRFPEVPLLFIIRHPCAVVLSRMQLDWATDTDIAPFLSQTQLVDDFLAERLDVIRRAQTVEEKHTIIWCISNLVPIKQFGSNGVDVVFYETLCTQPEREIPRIFQSIGFETEVATLASVNRPSLTTVGTSAIVTGDNLVTAWKNRLSPRQIRNILSVVQDFELDYIYGDSATPLVTTK